MVVAIPLPGILLTNDLFAKMPGFSSLLGTEFEDVSLGDKAVQNHSSLSDAADFLASELSSTYGARARAVLVGHSYGGYAALEFASRHPHLLAGLVLISTQVRADTEHMIERRQEQLRLMQDQGLDGVLETITPFVISPPPGDDERAAELAAEIRRMAGLVGPEAFSRQVHACCSRKDQRETLSKLHPTIPILNVHGKADKITPPRVHQEMKRLLHARGADQVSQSTFLKEAGHLVPLEAPEHFAQLLAEWRSEVAWRLTE